MSHYAHHRSPYKYLRKLLRDLLIVVASIILAVMLAKGGVIESFLEMTRGNLLVSSIIAGAFFTSIFTVAPAGVALIALSQAHSPIWVALFGALGAMCIDSIVINFIRKDVAKDLSGFTKRTFRRHIIKAFHFGFLKWAAFLSGLFLVATPLPDEAGLFLVGISKVNVRLLPVVIFLAHFIGIYLILTIANAI
jgi:hypothetical protein